VSLPLAVPVAPGEVMTINGAEVTPWIIREVESFRYRSVGDFAEDRLIWRKVRLPRGAKVEQISPEPVSRFTQDGYEYLMWRQFYRKGEVKPLEVLYSLD
jgi:hypothetical protein